MMDNKKISRAEMADHRLREDMERDLPAVQGAEGHGQVKIRSKMSSNKFRFPPCNGVGTWELIRLYYIEEWTIVGVGEGGRDNFGVLNIACWKELTSLKYFVKQEDSMVGFSVWACVLSSCWCLQPTGFLKDRVSLSKPLWLLISILGFSHNEVSRYWS